MLNIVDKDRKKNGLDPDRDVVLKVVGVDFTLLHQVLKESR